MTACFVFVRLRIYRKLCPRWRATTLLRIRSGHRPPFTRSDHFFHLSFFLYFFINITLNKLHKANGTFGADFLVSGNWVKSGELSLASCLHLSSQTPFLIFFFLLLFLFALTQKKRRNIAIKSRFQYLLIFCNVILT